MTEVWKDIKGYEGMYQVSSFGRVKGLDRKVMKWDGERSIYEKLINIENTKNGYQRVSVHKNSTKKRFLLHRLVALHFIPNTNNKPCINHKNGIKTDNRVVNLEWCTHSENTQHAIKNRLLTFKTGEKHHSFGKKNSKQCREKISESNSKLILDTKTGIFFKNTIEASKAYGIPVCTISRYLTGKIKKNKTNLKYV